MITNRQTNSLTPYIGVCGFFLSDKFATSLLASLAGGCWVAVAALFNQLAGANYILTFWWLEGPRNCCNSFFMWSPLVRRHLSDHILWYNFLSSFTHITNYNSCRSSVLAATNVLLSNIVLHPLNVAWNLPFFIFGKFSQDWRLFRTSLFG